MRELNRIEERVGGLDNRMRDVEQAVVDLRGKVETASADNRTAVANVHTEVANARSDIHKEATHQTRWLVGTAIAGLVAIAGLLFAVVRFASAISITPAG